MDTFTITFEGKEGTFAVRPELWDLHSLRLCDIFPTKISKSYPSLLLSSTGEDDKDVYGLDRILLEIYDASPSKTGVTLVYGEAVKVVIVKDGIGAKGGLYYCAFHDVGKILRDHHVVYHNCSVTVNERPCCKKYLKDRLHELIGTDREALIRVSLP
ncbi:hypothetical protein LPJ70_006343, partial [Coemansia sp. RSA 2708]